MESNEKIIAQTQKWINDVVIGLNFCPFAAKEVKQNKVHYEVVVDTEAEICLEVFLQACAQLDTNEAIETTLIILPNGYDDFETYLDLVDYAETLLEQHDYEGIYQVASFHPEYKFADSEENDPANFTNRSPYPMLHLLREESVEQAIARYPNHEDIPQRNIDLARQKGLQYMQALRDACK